MAGQIQFALVPGQLCGIVGVNGIGKSTLLRTLAHLQPKCSGNIAIGDKPLENLTPEERAARIGVVLTEAMATKNMTVEELVALGRHPYTNWLGSLAPSDLQNIQEAIALVQLETLRHKKCYELSDGQLQKVLIARALAQDTSILFLDEPTTHLDLYHRAQVVQLLKRIAHQTQKVVCYTTHEIDLALEVCDRVLVLNGTDNTFGSPEELIQKGCFDRLFPKDSIVFDPKTRRFKIQG